MGLGRIQQNVGNIVATVLPPSLRATFALCFVVIVGR